VITLVCLMLEEVAAIDNIAEIVTVKGVDVLFIGRVTFPVDGLPGAANPRGAGGHGESVKRIRDAGIAAG